MDAHYIDKNNACASMCARARGAGGVSGILKLGNSLLPRVRRALGSAGLAGSATR